MQLSEKQLLALDAAIRTAQHHDNMINPLGWLNPAVVRVIRRAERVERARAERFEKRRVRVDLQRQRNNLKKNISAARKRILRWEIDLAVIELRLGKGKP